MPSSTARGIRSVRTSTSPGAQRSSGLLAAHEDGGVAVTFDAVHQHAEPADGERRLLLAVLEDGIRTALKYAGATRGRARRLYREAVSWLASDARADVCQFARICEALEIDQERLRERVMARVRAVDPARALAS